VCDFRLGRGREVARQFFWTVRRFAGDRQLCRLRSNRKPKVVHARCCSHSGRYFSEVVQLNPKRSGIEREVATATIVTAAGCDPSADPKQRVPHSLGGAGYPRWGAPRIHGELGIPDCSNALADEPGGIAAGIFSKQTRLHGCRTRLGWSTS